MFNIKTCPKIKRHLAKWLLLSSFDVLPISFPFCFIAPPFPCFGSHFVVFYSTMMGVFDRFFGFGFVGMLQGPSCLSTCGSPHFQWGHKVDFLEGHCSSCLSRELDLSSFCHSFQVFIGFRSFLLEVIGMSSLKPLPFQVHMKSMQKLIPLRLQHVQLAERGTYRIQENIQRDYTTILLLTSFLIYLLISIEHA